MKRSSLYALAVASLSLGGCATYDYVGDTAPGGYYHGRPSTQYYDPYGGGYYGGGGVYGSYGYGSPYGYRGYYPYYGYYGPYYPYYPPHHHPRPPRPGDSDKPPGGGNRPPPWRDPTGRWREGGSQPMVPNRAGQALPSPSQPRVGEGGHRPPRVMPAPSAPRATERPQRMERQAPARIERPAPPPRPSGRSDNTIRQREP